MIGLGTHNDGEYAIDFITATGTYSFPMYWDDTSSAWAAFDVVVQPAAVLLSPGGEVIDRWPGMFDADEVLGYAAAL